MVLYIYIYTYIPQVHMYIQYYSGKYKFVLFSACLSFNKLTRHNQIKHLHNNRKSLAHCFWYNDFSQCFFVCGKAFL